MYGDRKQVFISGTASIDNRGRIVYPGDIVKTNRADDGKYQRVAERGGRYYS